MNTQQCIMTLEAIQSGCKSSAEFWAAISELSHRRDSSGPEPKKRGPKPLAERSVEEQAAHAAKKAAKAALKASVGGGGAPPSDTEGSVVSEVKPVKQTQKQSKAEKKAAKAEGGSVKEKKPPTAWNLLVTSTVAEMKSNGWQSFTSSEGVVWPGSKWASVTDKKGAVSDQFVYASGEHEGKPPSPALGGMLRASYLKGQSDPEAKAKAEAHRAKIAEKRSVSSASASASAAEEPVAAPGAAKKTRAKMTEEQKAAAKAKRDAKKAALSAVTGLEGEWAELEQE